MCPFRQSYRICSLAFLATLMQLESSALVEMGGAFPVEDRIGWPKGVVEVANLNSRFQCAEGRGPIQFAYHGDTDAFNEALAAFGRIETPELELVVHGYPLENYYGDSVSVDWTMQIWTIHAFHHTYNNPGSGPFTRDLGDPKRYGKPPIPQMDVFVGERSVIDWSKVAVPKKVRIIDCREIETAYASADGGALSGSVFNMSSAKPIESATITLTAYNIVSPGPAPTAKTGTGGKFILKNVPLGGYHVEVRAKGYAPRQQGHIISQSMRCEEVIAYLAPLVNIEGAVTDQEDQPVSGLTLEAWKFLGLDGQPYENLEKPQPAITDSAGHFHFDGIPEGYVHIISRNERWHLNNLDRWYTTPRLDGYEHAPTVLRLTALQSGTIRGHIVDETGHALAGAFTISLRPDEPSLGKTHRDVTTKADGLYQLSSVPPAKYTLGIDVEHENLEANALSVRAVVHPGETVTVNLTSVDQQK